MLGITNDKFAPHYWPQPVWEGEGEGVVMEA